MRTLVGRVVHRWASAEFEARYARLLLAMSLDQAKSILGFPPNSAPSPLEITKAYRSLAFENHPDRGGNSEKMVEINVAKDVLEGKGRTWTPEPAPKYRREPPPKQEPDAVLEGQSFEQAWADNPPPADTEWKFVSTPEWYFEKSYYPGHRVWTLYGRTDSKHIFCAIKERGESNGTIPTDKGQTKILEDWQVSFMTAPIEQDLLKIAPKYLKSVSTGWADDVKPKAAKKFVVWPGGRPTDEILKKIPRSGGAALKDILIGTGLGDESLAAKRKSVVEMYTKSNKHYREKIRSKKEQGKPVTNADQYDFFVRINGKEAQLSDDTVDNLVKRFIPWVLNWEIAEGRTYTLSKMRGGRFKYDASAAIQVLADNLTSEPSWLHIALEKAAEEYTTESKTAGILKLRSEMTLKQASTVTGLSMYELFQAIHT